MRGGSEAAISRSGVGAQLFSQPGHCPSPGQGVGEAGRWRKPRGLQELSVSGGDDQPSSFHVMCSSNEIFEGVHNTNK